MSRDLKLRKVKTKENVDRLEFPIYEKIPNNTNDVYIRLRKGENLMQLAYKHYGDATKWYIIAIANDILLPYNVDENKIIRIPTKTSIK